VIPLTDGTVVTNHLVSARWKDDPINRFRRDELTSRARAERGQKLVGQKPADRKTEATSSAVEAHVLAILRDKGEAGGKPLHLGNRAAIDSLIATHSVVYNGPDNHLYVSRGPSLAGAFVGFDLGESFRQHQPVVIAGLPRDPLVSDETYSNVKRSFEKLSDAERLIRKKDCSSAASLIESAHSLFSESYNYYMTLGDDRECLSDHAGAMVAWKEAQRLSPAYASERKYLEKKLTTPQ